MFRHQRVLPAGAAGLRQANAFFQTGGTFESELAENPSGPRVFGGGSDAVIIMGNDEAALIRLWREKRGEAEPQDLVRQLGRAAGRRHRGGYTGRRVTGDG